MFGGPLIRTIYYGELTLVNILLKHEANQLIRTKARQTARNVVKEKGYTEVAKKLKSAEESWKKGNKRNTEISNIRIDMSGKVYFVYCQK